jgi:arylsulfatase
MTVDGKELSRQTMEHTIPFLMSLDKSLDIGMDTRTPVDSSYQLPFRFTGKIDKLTYKIAPEQLSAKEREIIQRMLANAHD